MFGERSTAWRPTMIARGLAALTVLGGLAALALAQTADVKSNSATAAKSADGWRNPATGVNRSGAESGAAEPGAMRPISAQNRATIAKVTRGIGTLPNDAGQEWRDYDITPYTMRVTSTNRPEQAIVDWILRETGYEAWHSEPLGLLSANRRTLRVYHTPEMHALVADVVDRFVNSEAESNAFGLRIVTMGSPNWRSKALRMLKPVSAQTQGVQAWLLAKEDAALLTAELRQRSDFREHSSPQMLVNNGQSTVVTATRPRNYVRDVLLRGATWPGFEPQVAQIDEGFSLEFNPLLSLDSKTIDAIIKCNVDQVEKLLPVMLDVPTPAAPRQRTKVEVPQITSCRLHERFRWPTDQVLLISLGVVASPSPTMAGTLNLAPLTGNDGSRADLLIFVESKGKTGLPATALRGETREASNFRGRY
jgi:hypothetical protein